MDRFINNIRSKAKYLAGLILLMLVLLKVSDCLKQSDTSLSNLRTVVEETNGDFTFSASAARAYDIRTISEEAFYDFEFFITYNGPLPELKVWGSRPPYLYSIRDNEGNAVTGSGCHDVLNEIILTKGEKYCIQFDDYPEYNYDVRVITTVGNYTARVHLLLHYVDIKTLKTIEFDIEIPFSIIDSDINDRK